MISSQDCFPSDWIGSKLELSSNGQTYYIHAPGRDAQVSYSGYSFSNAYWIQNDGVLVVETTKGVKLFYVGYDKCFQAYAGEKYPHDSSSYENAVRKCKKMREEEANKNKPKQKENKSKQKETKDSDKKGKGLFGRKKKNESENQDTPKPILDYTPEPIDDSWELDEKLLGPDFEEKEPNWQVNHLLSLYKSGQADSEQLLDKLEDILDALRTDVIDSFDLFEEQVKDSLSSIDTEKWTAFFLQQFPPISRTKYLDLNKDISDYTDNGIGEVKSSGFFDFSAKMKNKEVTKLKESRSDSIRELYFARQALRKYLIRLEKYARRYINLTAKVKSVNKELDKKDLLDSLFDKKSRDIRHTKKGIKEDIKLLKEDIRDLYKDFRETYDELQKYESQTKKVSEKLYKLTKADLYLTDLSISKDTQQVIEAVLKKSRKFNIDFSKMQNLDFDLSKSTDNEVAFFKTLFHIS